MTKANNATKSTTKSLNGVRGAAPATRRNVMNMIVRGTAAAVAVIPAIAQASLAAFPEASQIDPIFAAIEAHRRAVACVDEFIVQEGDLEDEIPSEKRRTGWHAGDGIEGVQIVETDDPRWIAHEVEYKKAAKAEKDATLWLANVFATTPQGVIALLTYAIQQEARGLPWPTGGITDPDDPDFPSHGASWYYFVHRNIISTLDDLIMKAA
jgi:hypothetical protein